MTPLDREEQDVLRSFGKLIGGALLAGAFGVFALSVWLIVHLFPQGWNL